ncbi:unnamed protein product [Calypogeia fissa]
MLFKRMAVVLHAVGFPEEIKGPNVQKCFNHYVAKYKEAEAFKCGSGQGLTKDDLLVGITLEEKVNKMCPHFEHMQILFGERHNVKPPADGEFGRDQDVIRYAPGDDDSSDEDDDGPAHPIFRKRPNNLRP